MGITHCHSDVSVAENFLQNQNVPAVHHKVAGKCMAQYMGKLAGGEFNACAFQSRAESVIAGLGEQSAFRFR